MKHIMRINCAISRSWSESWSWSLTESWNESWSRSGYRSHNFDFREILLTFSTEWVMLK